MNPEIDVEAIPPISKKSQIIVKPEHNCLTFNCSYCGFLLAVGYKSIWEADPDRTGEVSFRCSKCKHVIPMTLVYRSARSNAIFVPIVEAYYANNRKKLNLSEFNEQIAQEGVK